MQYDLSIIIPTYNAKDTLKNTLDSIKIQKTNFTYEVIIVNDCSNYDYIDYINKYKKYYNIKEIKTNTNVGPGLARQFGIDNSNSKYITFIDSDDIFYNKNSLNKMYNKITKDNSDLLIANFIYKRDNIIEIKKENFVWLHGKMYKREFLNKYDIKFNTSRANEDNGFNRLILLLEPKISFLDKEVYVYNDNLGSTTRKNNRSYKFYGLKDFIYNMNWAIEEFLKRKKDDDIYLLANDVLITLYIYYLGYQNEYDVNEILIWASPLKEKSKFIFNNELNTQIEDKRNQLSYEVKFDNYNITFKEFYNKIKR